MPGRTLDARSYTTLLLVIISTLLALNLFAQRREPSNAPMAVGDRPAIYDQQDNYSEAAATAEIAAATREVAAANEKIASAIKDLASQVGRLEMSVNVDASQGESSSSASTGASQSGTIRVQGVDEPDEFDIPSEGTFEVRE